MMEVNESGGLKASFFIARKEKEMRVSLLIEMLRRNLLTETIQAPVIVQKKKEEK